MRLSTANLGALAPRVARPAYDRATQRCGIVHLGIGAFHRAHQAVYTDDAMSAGDRNWGIVGVSLRSAEVRDQLQAQNGLYTVVQRGSGMMSTQLIGAVQRVLVAPEMPQDVIDVIADRDTHVVTVTVTEKGYWRRADGSLDLGAPAVARDLDPAAPPQTLFGFVARALLQRRRAGLPGLSLLSCDNLAENGALLQRLMQEFLQRFDATLADWCFANCSCPSTMVDRIVPATTATEREVVAADIGLRDEATVITEPFRQWVIEDRFAGPRPRWELGGAQIVADVRAHEAMKLRMLNGAHSALAYLGLHAGHEFVHQAIADPAIRPVIERLMRTEAAASLTLQPGLDTDAYADALLQRFANAALPHRLAQIAMDGSQKIPQRWLQAMTINRAAARECPATLRALAAWLLHVRGDARRVDDPLAAELAGLWHSSGRDGIVRALFGDGGLFARSWTASAADQLSLQHELKILETR